MQFELTSQFSQGENSQQNLASYKGVGEVVKIFFLMNNYNILNLDLN